MPAAFLLLLAAQFASALADNALLIVTIDLLQQRAMPGWLAPLLKVAFIAAYVLLAPFVGPLADSFPKAKLMTCMNAVKICGVLALIFGVHPVAAFLVVGLGAEGGHRRQSGWRQLATVVDAREGVVTSR